MQEIYQLIEKFKTACEDIAEIKRLLTWQVEHKVTQPLRETVAAMPLTNSMQEIVESITPNPFDRKAIKARLDELKILYQPRANTSTLVKLLESVEAQTVEVEIPGEAIKKQSQTFEAPAKDAGGSVPKEKPVEETQAQRDSQFIESKDAGDSTIDPPTDPPNLDKSPSTPEKDLEKNPSKEPAKDNWTDSGEPQKTLELPSLDDFTHMLKAWAVQNGTSKVRKMLADNNVARISELSDEQRAIIWKQCNA